MKYDNLFLCRNMMRFYSLIECGANNIFTAPQSSGLWKDYRILEDELIPAFEEKGIHPVPVSVISDFNGKICTVLEMTFCLENPGINVPMDLYEKVAPYGKKGFPYPPQPPVIRFGYTGRCYDYKSKTKLITDGVQVGELRKIVLDLYSLKCMTRDGITCRLTHELLHVFGVSEGEMPIYKGKAYIPLRKDFYGLSDTLMNSLGEASLRFESLCCQIGAENPDFITRMEDLGNRLMDAGFPYPPSKVLSAEIRLPEGVRGDSEVIWGNHNILYM